MAIRRIGLTGGIGSGKSTVAAVWAARGATLVDTDAIARSLTEAGGAAMTAVRREFGEQLVDAHGALDRQRMRQLAFADPSAKRRLEAILHPLIGAEATAQAARSASPVVVFDVPLMAESSHWRSRCDRVLVVDCSEQTQVERVMRRAGWQEEQVRRVDRTTGASAQCGAPLLMRSFTTTANLWPRCRLPCTHCGLSGSNSRLRKAL